MIAWVIAASGVTASEAVTDTNVRTVLASALQERFGVTAAVSFDIRLLELPAGTGVDSAEPEPGARTGRPARYRLRLGGRPVGYAVAVAHAVVPHARVARPVAAGAILTDEDVSVVVGDPGSQLIEPLPLPASIVGSRAARALMAGEVVTARSVRVPPAVRSGESVSTRARVGNVEASGSATALQSGNVGDVIRLVNPESRKQLKGRVVARGQVEVVHES